MRTPPRRPARALTLTLTCALLVAASASLGCQEVRDKRVALTQDQWRRVRGLISSEAPSPKVKVGAVFGLDGQPMIELVGYTLESNALITGKPFTLTWHWKALADMDADWKVFVHLVPKRGGFQNLDHYPVEGLFRTNAWEPQTFLTDAHQGSLKADFPTGPASLYVGWFSEKDNKRLELLDPGSAQGSTPNDPGKLFVGDLSARNDKLMTLPKVSSPTIDGKLSEPFWKQPSTGRSGRFVNAVNGQNVSTSAEAWGVYTDEALYFAFEVKDSDLRATFTQRDDKLWEQDCIEVYLNPEGDDGTYWELQFSPGLRADPEDLAAPIFDAYFEGRRQPHWERAKLADMPGLEAAVHRQGSLNDAAGGKDISYTLEVRIPFNGLSQAKGALQTIQLPSIPPKEGETWRVNFFHVDLTGEPRDGNGPAYAAWSAAGGDFHNLDAFGTIAFGAALPDKPPPPAQAPRPPTVTAFTASMGKRVQRLPDAFTQGRNDYFATCLPSPLPADLPPQRLALRVIVGEDGKPRSVERQGAALIDEAVTTCAIDKVRAWEVALRPLPDKVDQPAAAGGASPDGASPAPDAAPDAAPTAKPTEDPDAALSFTINIQYSPGRAVPAPQPSPAPSPAPPPPKETP